MRRAHFFEVFALANLVLIAVAFRWTAPIVAPLYAFVLFTAGLTANALVGIGIRVVIAYVRRDRDYLRAIRDRAWIVETFRLIVGGAIVVLVYGWIKLIVPVVHPRTFDPELWNLDRMLAVGIAPAQFFLELFRAGWFLRTIDWAYANIFFASTTVASMYFFSHPRRDVRIGFANGNAALWIVGAWLYLLVPSVGPAFRFPEVWMAHARDLRLTQTMQALLMRNYQNVIRLASGGEIAERVRIVFGIGAFPSLHVAFQTYTFFWMRRLWTSGEVLFGIFAFTIFLGSMITGWHYLVDGIAGVLMAYACYRICFPRHAIDSGSDDAR